MIELQNISKQYGEQNVLENISFKVSKSDILALIGPNGVGKTTLLRIMAGLEKPTSGHLLFDGAKVVNSRLSEVRKRSTLVFQNIVLFNTTVYNNIAYGLSLRQHSKEHNNRIVKNVLSIVHLQGYEKRRAKKLSGGEQQRVSLARALALNTDVLLLDEPTANLDPKNVAIVEEVISRINRERKTTVVMATHNMFQVKNITKKAVFLLKGKVAEIGSPENIFQLPSKSLADFARIGNVFSGKSRSQENDTSIINVGDDVYIEVAEKLGGNVTVFVSPEDIILAKRAITSSARNMFKGQIIEISDLGSIVKLTILAKKRFTVQITKRSFTEMKLDLGSDVFLAFKASSVQIL